MKLGKYFTLEELTATKSGLPNKPNLTEQQALSELVKNILDPLRELYGQPILVNSGYRSPIVNAAVNGAKNSQHTTGQAADIDTVSDNALLFKLIRDNFTFDQLINENNYSWIHVSYREGKNRNEILERKNGKYKKLK